MMTAIVILSGIWAGIILALILLLLGILTYDWLRSHREIPLWRHDQARALRELRARYENPEVVERNAINGTCRWLAAMNVQLAEIRDLDEFEPRP